MAMTKKRRAENDLEIRDALDKYTNLAPLYDLGVSRIAWKPYGDTEIPKTVNLRFVERTLFNEGEIIAFNDEDLGALCLPAYGLGPRDVYGIPNGYNVWGYNGWHRYVPADKCVRILNNNSHTPSFPLVLKFAKILTNLDGMLDVNIETSKHPFIIQCTEEQRKTLENMINDLTRNIPYILGDKRLDEQALKVLPTTAQFNGESTLLVKNKVLNLCLTFLGYENSNTDKKERMVASEISSNYGIVEGIRKSMLMPRHVEDEMLEKLGWAMTPEWNSDVPTLVNRPDVLIKQMTSAGSNTEKEAESDETV